MHRRHHSIALAGVAPLVTAMSVLPAAADPGLVAFPHKHAEGVLYATVPRGNIKQELYTSPSAVEAAKSGRPLPSGTVITLVDTRAASSFVMSWRHTPGAPISAP